MLLSDVQFPLLITKSMKFLRSLGDREGKLGKIFKGIHCLTSAACDEATES